MQALAYLMSAYFHQDWDLDGGEVAHTVTRFMSEPDELTSACAEQIDELVHRDMAEGDLQEQLVAWGCDYRAGDTDDDYRRWLSEIRHQIRASAPA
jgi:predicted ArsR family transcriptional regulator